jgi:hypothetical protein
MPKKPREQSLGFLLLYLQPQLPQYPRHRPLRHLFVRRAVFDRDDETLSRLLEMHVGPVLARVSM